MQTDTRALLSARGVGRSLWGSAFGPAQCLRTGFWVVPSGSNPGWAPVCLQCCERGVGAAPTDSDAIQAYKRQSNPDRAQSNHYRANPIHIECKCCRIESFGPAQCLRTGFWVVPSGSNPGWAPVFCSDANADRAQSNPYRANPIHIECKCCRIESNRDPITNADRAHRIHIGKIQPRIRRLKPVSPLRMRA